MDVIVTRVRMRLRFSYDEPAGLQWTRDSGDLRSVDGSWRFQEREPGLTLATYTLEIGVGKHDDG